jgi:hypothetical protein
MKDEHLEKYSKLYKNLGLKPEDFDNLDAQARRERVKQEMVKEFCRDLCPSCADGCC